MNEFHTFCYLDNWSKNNTGRIAIFLFVVLLLFLFSLSVYLGFKMLYSGEEVCQILFLTFSIIFISQRDRLLDREVGAPNTRNIVAKWPNLRSEPDGTGKPLLKTSTSFLDS